MSDTPFFHSQFRPLAKRGTAALLALALSLSGTAPLRAADESDRPAERIDIGSLPAKIVDDVVVPVPSEVFGVLDKLGAPNWHGVLRKVENNGFGERPQIALLLGCVIAEGFIAVEAQSPEEVKKIGREVLNLAGAIGVRKSVISRTNSIIEAADNKDWPRIRVELDGAAQDVKTAMIELKDEQLAQLVSLGGWLRGTEAVTDVVKKNFSADGAELLHQPILLDHFKRQIDGMSPRLKGNRLVKQVRAQLAVIRPLIDQPGTVTEKSVEQIHAITRDLVKAISAQDS